MSKEQLTAQLLFLVSVYLARGSKVKNIGQGVSRHIRSIGFPEGSNMGIFFALGLPVEIPDKSVLFSIYMEANYFLPDQWNYTEFIRDDELWGRSINRKLVYAVLTNKLDSAGYPGEICLLKSICEAANYPLTGNGLLGDILQILFTPSSSRNENLPNHLTEAEHVKDCSRRYGKCSTSLLDHISHYILN